MMSLLSCADISIPHLCESDTSARRYRRSRESQCGAPGPSNLLSPRRLSTGVDHRHGRSAQNKLAPLQMQRTRAWSQRRMTALKRRTARTLAQSANPSATADCARSCLPSAPNDPDRSWAGTQAGGRPADHCRRRGQKRPPDRAPAILESKPPCPPPRNGISGPVLSPGTLLCSTSWAISRLGSLSLSPTEGEAGLLTTDSLVLSNDDEGVAERMVVALTTVRIEVCCPALAREVCGPLPVSA